MIWVIIGALIIYYSYCDPLFSKSQEQNELKFCVKTLFVHNFGLRQAIIYLAAQFFCSEFQQLADISELSADK